MLMLPALRQENCLFRPGVNAECRTRRSRYQIAGDLRDV